ncbi:MAG: hypothetical protein JNK65_01655, partial [Deltaproteobacteria bacterium]|nr:hypothetical protein [Deltaproteobacteria bacterium]
MKRILPIIASASLLLTIACSKNEEVKPNTKPAKDASFVGVPLGLSEDLKIPSDNPMTPEKVELGKMLYFDKRLS